ncbi:MAG: TolB family protein [Planctomycetota bacterium]|jgi:hypothetical protein
MHRLILTLGGVAALLLLAVSPTLAGKGGGGGKPGGGRDPVYTVSYQSGTMGSLPYVMTADGSTTKKLSRKLVWSTAWHADGAKLLVASDDFRGGPGVYELDLSGSETKLFDVLDSSASFAQPSMSPAASPTGERLIAYIDRDGSGSPLSLWVRNEDGTNPVEILPPETDVFLEIPAFHPSGDSIAVRRKTPGVPGKIWLLELDVDSSGNAFVASTSVLTGLAGTALEGVDAFNPAFSNSGEMLAVTGGGGIWFINVADPTDITQIVAAGELYGEWDNPIGGEWNATDDLFYFTACPESASRRKIHTLDSSGNVTNLGGKVGNQHWPACKKP